MTNALILNENQYALLVHNCKQYENIKNDGWEFPGGKVENGEKLEKSTIREVEEEIRCRIKIIKKQGKKILGEYETQTPEGDFLCRTYHAKIIKGIPEIQESEKNKLDEIDYFSYSKLMHLNERGLLAPNLVLALPKLREYMD